MKIAIVTDDGQTISQHFGRAQHYMVLTIENGQITERELRDKYGHHHGAEHGHGAGHHHSEGPQPIASQDVQCDPTSSQRFSQAAEDSHSRMVEPITDCQIVLARGMGAPAYYSLQRAGVRPMLVNEVSIDEAAQAYLAGRLADHKERLH
jgi:predicted Fe-Mo cluster-binding NifX family protein